MSKNPSGKNRETVPIKDNFELEVLQAQYKELKEKLCKKADTSYHHL
ncbi:LOW QUALITY PROTEIN: ATRIP isoform 3 [Pan troglodytes]|uniref:ATR interacting protein n=2 Tax=Homininae TaxID=207598 RepID=A0A1W2PQ89_HUMAN|nr:LOW QUALITY PROTEIN: ATRIP isoform 3 [Pan troglodytes]